jgi:hypothetical protein
LEETYGTMVTDKDRMKPAGYPLPCRLRQGGKGASILVPNFVWNQGFIYSEYTSGYKISRINKLSLFLIKNFI